MINQNEANTIEKTVRGKRVTIAFDSVEDIKDGYEHGIAARLKTNARVTCEGVTEAYTVKGVGVKGLILATLSKANNQIGSPTREYIDAYEAEHGFKYMDIKFQEAFIV